MRFQCRLRSARGSGGKGGKVYEVKCASLVGVKIVFSKNYYSS